MSKKTFFFKFLTKLPVKMIFRKIYGGKGIILFLHRVNKGEEYIGRLSEMKANEVSVSYLEELISYFKRTGYEFISMDEMSSRIKDKIFGSKKFVVLTFDDGYKDNYTIAYPLLKRLGIPFTIYIACSFPNKTAKLWWYMLEDAIVKTNRPNIRINLDNKVYYYDLYSMNKDKIFSCIRALILKCKPVQQDIIFSQIEQQFGLKLDNYVKELALSWDEIRTMSQDNLVTIGAHTINHYPLNTLDMDSMKIEVFGSKEIIEKKLGIEVRHFAYPYGSRKEADIRELNLLKSSDNFVSCVTTRYGNIFPEHSENLEALPRISIRGDQEDISYLSLHTSGLVSALKNKFRKIVTS